MNIPPPLPMMLIEPLPTKLEKTIFAMLRPGEEISIKLKGTWKEALVCTNSRLIIAKTGFMTGHFFGVNVFQIPLNKITSVQLNFHLMTGYLEVSAGGVQNLKKGYWDGTAAKSPNAIVVKRDIREKFQGAVDELNVRIAATGVPIESVESDSASPIDYLKAISDLATLRNNGVLTDDEFQKKKAVLLARI